MGLDIAASGSADCEFGCMVCLKKSNSSIDKEPLWVGQHFHNCTESSLFDDPPPPPKKEKNNYCKNVCKRIDIFNNIEKHTVVVNPLPLANGLHACENVKPPLRIIIITVGGR